MMRFGTKEALAESFGAGAGVGGSIQSCGLFLGDGLFLQDSYICLLSIWPQTRFFEAQTPSQRAFDVFVGLCGPTCGYAQKLRAPNH